jgi:hypothetical protein
MEIKNYNNFLLNLFIFFSLILLIILSLFISDNFIIHPDYNSIIVPVIFFLENGYWNNSDVNLIAYQPLLQKILIYQIKFVKIFSSINIQDSIPKLIILNNFFFTFASIILTFKILEKFKINRKIISTLPLFYLSIIPFCFSIMELRNDNLLILLTILFIYKIIKINDDFNLKNIFIISVISALALSTREIAFTYIIAFGLYLILNYNKIGLFKFVKFSFFYISLTVILYFLISFRSFEVLKNYYLMSPVFKPVNFSEQLFFMSIDGSGYMPFFGT